MVLLALLLAGPTDLAAQRIEGRVLDGEHGATVPSATVGVVDPEGETLERTITDDEGAFGLEVPVGREFHLAVAAFGYVPTTTQLFTLEARGRTVVVDLVVEPAAVDIEGIEVAAEAEKERIERWFRGQYGVHPASIGGKIVAGTELRRLAIPGRDLVDVLRWARLPGAVVRRSASGLCLSARGIGCAGVRLNGMPLPREFVETIPVESISAVVYLRSLDASVLFPSRGRRSSAGRLEIFTWRTPWENRGRR